MKKAISLLTVLLLVTLLAVPAAAASEKPVITLQPQSPVYPENSVAIYTVKAEGADLQAVWFMEWNGKTYNLSEIGGAAQQDWEGYAGESYGPRKPDDNTFAFLFEGIGKELDGARLWCEITNGRDSVASQKNRITVGSGKMPPEIVSIPTELTVELGDEAEIRCVARSTDGTQLSFLWYETDTGRLEDIRAVNRGTETTDYLLCETDQVGTRNYLCLVESVGGGKIYSSVVSVTVTEKQPITADPNNTHESSAPETDPATAPENAKQGEAESDTAALTTGETGGRQDGSFPLWGIALLCAAAAGAGFGAVYALIKKKR